jgi:hypothetical protein
MTRWVARELGPDVPLHFSAFHPDYKLGDVPPRRRPRCSARAASRAMPACDMCTPATCMTPRAAPPTAPAARRALIERDWGWHPDHDDWHALPVTDKAQLMAGFDDWVTDRAVKRADVQAFMADPRRIGCDYLGRYAVWSSSGTSGHPGIFLHDGAALATYGVLTTWRMQPQLLARCLWPGTLPTLTPARAALVAALDGHYAGISYWRRQLRLYPWLAGRSLELSVTEPIELTCERLTAFAPTFLASSGHDLDVLVDLAVGELAAQRQRQLGCAKTRPAGRGGRSRGP